jgi:hypothetical protein
MCAGAVLQVRNRNSEEYNVLKIQLEGIIEELERHFEQVRASPCCSVVVQYACIVRRVTQGRADTSLCWRGLYTMHLGHACLSLAPRHGRMQELCQKGISATNRMWHMLRLSHSVDYVLMDCAALTLSCCQAHKVYLEGTEHRTAAFNKLTQGDAGAARVIEQRMKKLIKLQVRLRGVQVQ